MSKTVIVVLILSLIGNAAGLFVLWKAMGYRKAFELYRERLENAPRDYSAWSHYRPQNEQILSQGDASPDVVFLGASITEDWDLSASFQELNVINRGITGNRVGGLLLRFNSDVASLKPRAVVAKICSINFRPTGSLSREEMADYMISIVRLAQANQIIPVLATVVPIRATGEQYGSYSVRDNVVQFNDWLKSFCEAENLPYIDYFAALADESGYLPDKYSVDIIHPNREGYRLMTDAASEVLNRVLLSGENSGSGQ